MADSKPAPSLAVRPATGAGWIMVWRMVTRILGVVSTIVLVRLLAPADFGLVALATTFTQIVEWLAVIGIYEAIIREEKTDTDLYNTAFTMTLIRGAVLGAVIALGAWPVAHFFNDPRLADILFVLAGVSVLSACENVGVIEFRRDMIFQKEFQLLVVPRIFGIVMSISAAFLFASYWALIVGILANRSLRLILTYVMHPFRARLRLNAWRRIIRFSVYSWLSAIVTMIRDRADTVVIGRVFGPASAGVYSVGWEIGSLTSTELVEPITSALFAGFSQGRRTGEDISAGYFKAISATFLLTLPMGVGLSMLAAPVIVLAFGTHWLEAVPLVQVFAIVCMGKVIAYFSIALLGANGLVHISFRVTLISMIARLILLFTLVTPLGMMGAVVATAATAVLEELIYLVITFRRFNLRATDLLLGTWRCMVATIVMGAVLYWCGLAWSPAPESASLAAWDLAIGVPIGAAAYTATVLALWLASGRPRGAEAMFLEVAGGTLRHWGGSRLFKHPR